jgi:hypothetical protein
MTKRKETRTQARDEWKEVVGCMSCGLPVGSASRKEIAEIGQVCSHCIDSGGPPKSYNEVFERLVTQHFMKQEKMSRQEAEKVATEHLKNVPAWRDL